MAYKHNLTCFNIVNVEDSPVTHVIDDLLKAQAATEKQVVLLNTDSDEEIGPINKNIGLYQKTGHCYSDIKSFLPQITCLMLVAIWFSDNKQKMTS
jgi:predicted homoserine dehydrogenase-like protein